MKLHAMQRRRQRGLSLMEMGIAGVIVAMLLVGALMAVQKVQLERQMHQARQEVSVTLAAISRSAATQPTTQNINTPTISLLEAWPPERVSKAGQADVRVAGPFPGSTEVVFGSSTIVVPRIRTSYAGFNYWISNIPARTCLPMLQFLVAQPNVARLSAGETAAVNPGQNLNAGAAQLVMISTAGLVSLDMANATIACRGSGNKQISVMLARV